MVDCRRGAHVRTLRHATLQASQAQERSGEPLARQVLTNLTLKLPVGPCTVAQLAAHIASQLDIPSGIESLPGRCMSPDAPIAEEIPLIGMAFRMCSTS